MSIPADLKYTKDHEWLSLQGSVATVGITHFAADALGDVVYVELPEVGALITSGEPCGEIESTKSVSDLYAPVGGEVTETNADVVEDPSLVNSEPFKRGWLFRVRAADGLDNLMDAAAYASVIENA